MLLPFLLPAPSSCIQDLTWIKHILAKIWQAKFKEVGAIFLSCIKQTYGHFVRALEKAGAFAARNLGMSASLFQHQEPKHFCGVIEGFCSLCVLPPGAGKKHWNVRISTWSQSACKMALSPKFVVPHPLLEVSSKWERARGCVKTGVGAVLNSLLSFSPLGYWANISSLHPFLGRSKSGCCALCLDFVFCKHFWWSLINLMEWAPPEVYLKCFLFQA